MQSLRYGWNIQSYREYRRLKVELISECRASAERKLEARVENLVNKYRDPKKFWAMLKHFKGTANNQSSFILNTNNQRVYDTKEKEKVFREIWRETFKISDEENEEFDEDTEIDVDTFLLNNWHRTIPRANIGEEILVTLFNYLYVSS